MTTQQIDNNAILDVTQSMTRDQALKVRESLRMLLRAVEDAHGLPHSFQVKSEQPQRTIEGPRRKL